MTYLWLTDVAPPLDPEPQEGEGQAALPPNPPSSLELTQSRRS